VGLSFGIAALKFLEPQQIILFEVWGWSWARAKLGGLPGAVLGIIFAAINGVGYGITYSYAILPAVWLIVVVGFGLTNGEIETKVVPNQGIRNTAGGALRLSLAISIPFGLANGIGYGLTMGWAGGIGNGLSAGIAFGITCWLVCGGLACIQHLIVRWLLYRQGVLPWNYAAFLDYAVERTFLRRIGGGYIFMHRLLLEYVATLDIAELPQSLRK
jgi:hypothetical protein